MDADADIEIGGLQIELFVLLSLPVRPGQNIPEACSGHVCNNRHVNKDNFIQFEILGPTCQVTIFPLDISGTKGILRWAYYRLF